MTIVIWTHLKMCWWHFYLHHHHQSFPNEWNEKINILIDLLNNIICIIYSYVQYTVYPILNSTIRELLITRMLYRLFWNRIHNNEYRIKFDLKVNSFGIYLYIVINIYIFFSQIQHMQCNIKIELLALFPTWYR
jgi:hypothetical protein